MTDHAIAVLAQLDDLEPKLRRAVLLECLASSGFAPWDDIAQLQTAARELLDLWDAGEDAGGEHDLDELNSKMVALRAHLAPAPTHSYVWPDQGPVITCQRCGRTTRDPDLWDPEADTGRIFCDTCWPHRGES